MPFLLVSVLGLGVAILILCLLRSVHLKSIQHPLRQKYRPVPKQQHRIPFDIDIIQQGLSAAREKRFPQYLIDSFEKMGVQTLRYSIFGSDVLVTIDHRTIQALLSTQFEDFDLGLWRKIHSSLRQWNLHPRWCGMVPLAPTVTVY